MLKSDDHFLLMIISYRNNISNEVTRYLPTFVKKNADLRNVESPDNGTLFFFISLVVEFLYHVTCHLSGK